MLRQISIVLFNVIIYYGALAQRNNLPSSPCPNVFQYKFDGNSWFGELEVASPAIEQREVILLVSLSLRAATSQNNVGSIAIVGTNEDVTNQILRRQPIKFQINFPYRYPIPKIVKIIYDGNLLCTGSEEIQSGNSVVSRIELQHVLNTYTNYQPSNADSNDNNNNNANSNGNNNNDFFDHISSTSNNPVFDYDFINHFSMGHFSPTTTTMNSVHSPVFPNSAFPSMPMVPIQHPNVPFMPPIAPIATTTTHRSSTTRRPSIQSSTSNDLKTICGTRYSTSEVTPFVFGGEETKRGEWPWMVAIYLNKPTGLSFNCGGTLISSNAVISAAHCINTSTKNYQPHEVLLWLGRYSLIDWSEEGAISSNIQRIVIHSDYKRQRESYDADIAILIMEKHVTYSEYIRPACLWSETTSIQSIEGLKGTVVGWGKDGTDKVVSNIPKKINLPIVNSITCVQTSESLFKAVSNRTFCAGTLEGDGPCHGDSGGGLTLYRNNRWILRGIVSAGLSDANSGACKLMDYVVFTDVSLFRTWIQSNIDLR